MHDVSYAQGICRSLTRLKKVFFKNNFHALKRKLFASNISENVRMFLVLKNS